MNEPSISDDAEEAAPEPPDSRAAVTHPLSAAWLRYLETGRIDPADAVHLSATPATWFAPALAEPAFVEALRSLGERPEALRRLLESLPPDERFRLLEALAPAHAGFLRVFLELGTALAADATLSARQRRDCARLHWHIVLAGLLDADAPGFSVAGFLDDAGHRIAQRLGLPIGTYVERMLHQARPRAGAEPRFRPVADGLEALRPALPKPAAEAPPPSLQPRRAGEPIDESEAELPLPGSGGLPALLRHFLQCGGLPAGEAELAPRELGQRLLLEAREQPAAYRALFQWAAGRELERLRLVTAFAPSVLAEVLGLLLPADGGAARQVLDGLAELAGRLPGQEAERWRHVAAGELLRSIALQRGRSWNAAEFFYALLQRLATEFHLAPDRIGEHLAPLLLGRGDAARWLPALRQAVWEWRLQMNAAAAGAGAAQRRVAPGPARTSVSRPAGRAGAKKSAAAPESRTAWPMRRADDELPAAEPYFVDNAGLVLLWPFLPRYFQMLELTRGHAFRDATAQSRALYLLHFLATGAEEAPEHRLLLNKILCGLPTALPPEPQAPLTEAERNLSEELLYGVTRNWDKLRNTSIAGLREAFLQREGRLLKKDDDSWSLAVAGKPYDMLLDSLPWSLSTIRLGWMPQVLFVQWR